MELVTDPEEVLCQTCGQLPSEAQKFFMSKDSGQIEAFRCDDPCHMTYDQSVGAITALTNERNDLALQLAAFRGCFNMLVNTAQQAYLSGFVEGRKGATPVEQAWLASMVKKQVDAAVKEAERPVEEEAR